VLVEWRFPVSVWDVGVDIVGLCHESLSVNWKRAGLGFVQYHVPGNAPLVLTENLSPDPPITTKKDIPEGGTMQGQKYTVGCKKKEEKYRRAM